ncbi:MAG: cyclic nucleotide-binding domain-containing protein [bacterium]|nr:cyclic nucleotide-binding domain-containing protein [bacterium]
MTRLPLLRPVPLFRGFSKSALLQVARKSVEETHPSGSVLIREGEEGGCLGIIISGTVEVHKGDRVVAELTAGDFFGELSLIDGEPRSADVVAIDNVTLLTLSAAEFDALLSDPYFSRAVISSLAKRFRELLENQGMPAP